MLQALVNSRLSAYSKNLQNVATDDIVVAFFMQVKKGADRWSSTLYIINVIRKAGQQRDLSSFHSIVCRVQPGAVNAQV